MASTTPPATGMLESSRGDLRRMRWALRPVPVRVGVVRLPNPLTRPPGCVRAAYPVALRGSRNHFIAAAEILGGLRYIGGDDRRRGRRTRSGFVSPGSSLRACWRLALRARCGGLAKGVRAGESSIRIPGLVGHLHPVSDAHRLALLLALRSVAAARAGGRRSVRIAHPHRVAGGVLVAVQSAAEPDRVRGSPPPQPRRVVPRPHVVQPRLLVPLLPNVPVPLRAHPDRRVHRPVRRRAVRMKLLVEC